MLESKRMLTLFNSKEKELAFDLQELEWISLETLEKNEWRWASSSHPLEKKMNIYTKLRLKWPFYPHSFNQFSQLPLHNLKDKNALLLPRKWLSLKRWHKNQDITLLALLLILHNNSFGLTCMRIYSSVSSNVKFAKEPNTQPHPQEAYYNCYLYLTTSGKKFWWILSPVFHSPKDTLLSLLW